MRNCVSIAQLLWDCLKLNQDHYFNDSFPWGEIIKYIFKLAVSLKSIIFHLKKGPVAQ
jgi:hypothetical protein